MSVTGIGPLQRATTPTAADFPAPSSARPTSASATDAASVPGQPPTLRFPWLSRLSAELQLASGQIPPFAPAPVAGDHLDKEV